MMTRTVEDRLRDARNQLALIIAALSADTSELPIDNARVEEAVWAAALHADEELHWLAQLPADLLNTPAPTNDEREETVLVSAGKGGAR